MAYILTPRFAQAHQAQEWNPFGFCASSSRPISGHCNAQQTQPRPNFSPFASFFSQLDDLVSEIDRESQRQAQVEAQREAHRIAQIQLQREAFEAHIGAQRAACHQRQAQIEAHIAAQIEAHRQRQLCKRASRAQFAVTQNERGWQVNAKVHGFQQENISIEVTDEDTLKIAGNTEWGVKPKIEAQPEVESTSACGQSTNETSEQPTEQVAGDSTDEQIEDITLETESHRPTTPDSDTFSHKSYQATVEDEFEDLGPEASSLFSITSTPATPSNNKDKSNAVEQHETVEDPELSLPTEAAVVQQPQPESPAQQQEVQEQPQGFFERTYRFPERIDADGVRASFKDGVLIINVPRVQVPQARRIAIL